MKDNAQLLRIAIRYTVAVALVAAAVLTRHWLVSNFGPMPLFITFYPAVLLAASIAGGGPGILASVLSSLAALYWYIEPYHSFAISAPNDAIALAVFFCVSLALSIMMERLRRARWSQALSVAHEQDLALLDMRYLVSLDMDRRIMRWSKGCNRLYGFDAQEAQGCVVDELLQTSFTQPLEQILHDLMEHNYWEGELTRRRKDGKELALAILLAVRRDEQGNPTAILEVSTDITRQKESEAILREREYFFRESQRAASIGSYKADFRAGVWESSEVMDAIFGIDEHYNRSIQGWLDLVHPDDRGMLEQYLRYEVIAGGKPFSKEYRIVRADDGETRWVHGSGEVQLDGNGATAILIGTIRDITDTVLAEKEKTKLESQLRQAHKMEAVGRLAGGVAHDFNNMLTIIFGHVQLSLMDANLAPHLRASLEEIHKAAERSADLTKQLLAFARKQIIAPTVLDLNEAITCMLKMLQRLIGEDIHLTWKPAKTLWPVKMDPSQIDQILVNLCINARDAISDVGKITIETENRTFDKDYCARHLGFQPGEYARIAVSDNGCGMDKETLSNIFEPFFTTKGSGKGTGLGLATVYGIVKQNNGFINVYSELDQGTTFTIYLPRHEGSAGQADTHGTKEPPSRGQETILLVEDEPAILEIAFQMLKMLGYRVLTANTTDEAIRLAGEHAGEIHLLMTDVIMPGMNGRDLATCIFSGHPHLKHLFMSGYTANVIAHHGVLDEGVNFIQKPFSLPALANKVRKILDTP